MTGAASIYRLPAKELYISLSETYRYLGYMKVDPDETTAVICGEVIKELVGVATPFAAYKCYDISTDPDTNRLDLGFCAITSRDLMRNLNGCCRMYLFGATIGPRVDAVIHRYSRTDPLRALVAQAAGAMLVESLCDSLNSHIRETEAEDGYSVRPRYSPGFGDVPLTFQREIFTALPELSKNGLTLSESCLMMPSKSVTAMIGVKARYEA